jgi:hypothetical protein
LYPKLVKLLVVVEFLMMDYLLGMVELVKLLVVVEFLMMDYLLVKVVLESVMAVQQFLVVVVTCLLLLDLPLQFVTWEQEIFQLLIE